MSETTPLRLAYVADTMVDVRNLEGLAARATVTALVPDRLGGAIANHWPPRRPVALVRLPGGRLRFALAAARWLVRNRRRIDVVFALDNLVAAAAANLAHRLGGPPVVLQVGRPTLDYLACQRGLRPAPVHAARTAVARALVWANERAASGIGAVSAYCARQCARRNRRVRVIPAYGVDTDVFAPRLTKRAAKARLGFDPDRPVVLLRSRLAPEKDPGTFLEAVRALRQAGRDVVAVYMGGEHEAMYRLARTLGVELVARAPSSFEEIPVWYMAADVDVQTSRAEGLGISPLESLACGTPVVVSDTGGLPEVVDGGRVGTLVPPGDHLALARAIAAVLDDPGAAERARTEGRRWVEDRFRADDAFDRWIALAREVAGPVPPARRRVLFVDHETRLSGGERDLVELVGALGRSVDAHVALPGDGPLADALRAAGATVHVVPMDESLLRTSRWDLARRPALAARRAGAAAAAAVRLGRLARSLRPDVVHSNSQKAHLLAVPAALACRAPHVWHVHDILEPGWLSRAFHAAAAAFADRVLAISAATAAPFERSAARGRVRVVYPGVRTAPVGDGERLAWRRRLGAAGEEPLVGIVGQIARWKGQDVFLAAARLVAERRPEVRFAVVGACLFPGNEAAYEAELHRLVRAWDLGDRVTFTGAVDPVDPVMAALDVLVHASRLPEPFGRVLVEAMAQGTPVVATANGAGPEVVAPGAGLLVPPERPELLADAVLDLLAAGKPNEAARAAAARFSVTANAAAVAAVWDEVVR
jgi:glycosyltransferase involved in cell wall biosynthesis